jgi:hypothetical protein
VLESLVAIAEAEHTPARTGTYSDPTRKRHQRDRWAKWGTAKGQPQSQQGGKANTITGKNLISAAGMKVTAFSSANADNGKFAYQAIDGNPRTVWHTSFSQILARHPHELVIDLGAQYEVSGFRYLARQDGGWNGAFAETEFYLAETLTDFPAEPSAKVTFTKSRTAQSADLAQPVKGRFVKIRILSEVNGGAWGSAAEIGVIGTR